MEQKGGGVGGAGIWQNRDMSLIGGRIHYSQEDFVHPYSTLWALIMNQDSQLRKQPCNIFLNKCMKFFLP